MVPLVIQVFQWLCIFVTMLLKSLCILALLTLYHILEKYDKLMYDPTVHTTRNIIIPSPQAYGVTHVTQDFVDELLRQEQYDAEDHPYNGWEDPEIYYLEYAKDPFNGWGVDWYPQKDNVCYLWLPVP